MTFAIYEKKGFSSSSRSVTKDDYNKVQHMPHSVAAVFAESG